MLVFTGIAILGNYLGVPVVEGQAIVNARAVGSTLAGLLGGPVLGFLGLYINVIFLETKNRPNYIVKDVVYPPGAAGDTPRSATSERVSRQS